MIHFPSKTRRVSKDLALEIKHSEPKRVIFEPASQENTEILLNEIRNKLSDRSQINGIRSDLAEIAKRASDHGGLKAIQDEIASLRRQLANSEGMDHVRSALAGIGSGLSGIGAELERSAKRKQATRWVFNVIRNESGFITQVVAESNA